MTSQPLLSRRVSLATLAAVLLVLALGLVLVTMGVLERGEESGKTGRESISGALTLDAPIDGEARSGLRRGTAKG